MQKINGFLYITNEELISLTKNDTDKLVLLQKQYGELRDIAKYRYINSEKEINSPTGLPNRSTRRSNQFHAMWRNGFQKTNSEHRTKHKPYNRLFSKTESWEKRKNRGVND